MGEFSNVRITHDPVNQAIRADVDVSMRSSHMISPHALRETSRLGHDEAVRWVAEKLRSEMVESLTRDLERELARQLGGTDPGPRPPERAWHSGGAIPRTPDWQGQLHTPNEVREKIVDDERLARWAAEKPSEREPTALEQLDRAIGATIEAGR